MSLMTALGDAFGPGVHIRGHDRPLFGDFNNFEPPNTAMRGSVYLDPEALPAEAAEQPDRFDYADIIERGQDFIADFSASLGRPLRNLTLYQSPKMPRRRRTALPADITPPATVLLQSRTSLDATLWTRIAGRRATKFSAVSLAAEARLRRVAKSSLLLSGC